MYNHKNLHRGGLLYRLEDFDLNRREKRSAPVCAPQPSSIDTYSTHPYIFSYKKKTKEPYYIFISVLSFSGIQFYFIGCLLK